MSELVLIGISHKTAPLEIREKLAISEKRLHEALSSLKKECGFEEGLIVSTCNRVEVIAGKRQSSAAAEQVTSFLRGYHDLPVGTINPHLYVYRQRDLIRHVFRVASSLDSMVPGEAQILGQIKRAFAIAQQAGTAGAELNLLMPRAFFVAKRVRRETTIGHSSVSISSIAVELARKIFGDLEGRTVLLLGAGKMGEMAAAALLQHGASRLLVSNRTQSKAAKLTASIGGAVVAYKELENYLARADIVLVATGSDRFVVRTPAIERAIYERRNEPLFLIDISVPRNVDPAINDVANVFLYDLDDLQSVLETHLAQRQGEAERGEEIVSQEVDNYIRLLHQKDLGPLVQSLRERIEGICLEDLRRKKGSMSPEEYERLERVLKRAARRVAHPLIQKLKAAEENPDLIAQNIKVLRQAFNLEGD